MDFHRDTVSNFDRISEKMLIAPAQLKRTLLVDPEVLVDQRNSSTSNTVIDRIYSAI